MISFREQLIRRGRAEDIARAMLEGAADDLKVWVDCGPTIQEMIGAVMHYLQAEDTTAADAIELSLYDIWLEDCRDEDDFCGRLPKWYEDILDQRRFGCCI